MAGRNHAMEREIADLRSAIAELGSVETLLDPAVLDRILTAARFEEPDRVPIWDFIDSWPIYQRFAPGETDPVQATAKVFHGLGIDICRSVYMPLEPGARSEQPHVEFAGGTRWWVDKPIKTLDDLRYYEVPEFTERQAWEWAYNFVRTRKTFAPQTLLLPCDGVGFHAAYNLMGLELFSYALYDCPAEIERLVRSLNEHAAARARVFAEMGIGPFFFYGDDIAFKERPMFSPEVMHRLFYPCLERLCDILGAAGIRVIFHTDGYVMDIVEDLLTTGIVGLNPIEPLAGNDIGELKRRYGERLILVGNIDCSQTLPLGSVEEVRQAVKDCLRAAGHGGGLFIGSSSEIVPTTPVENILAFYEACHKFGTYPLCV
ncbi:MAG: uroporphyrinogen decarboxylase family protein [Candidatus Zipacnadales bacterium]